jgi:hypothetical protein
VKRVDLRKVDALINNEVPKRMRVSKTSGMTGALELQHGNVHE